jgi:2-polyprenyl-6-methoxyphenol hydroxylase-like FAD-dependent oxidoreductase
VQHDDRVSVTLDRKGQQTTLEATFVVGCDGAHSTVRHLLNLPFEGAEYHDLFLLADVETNETLPASELQLCPSELGAFAIFPMSATRRRVIATIETAEGDAPSLDLVRKVVSQRGPKDLEIRALRWSSYFHIHHRQVARLRVGRMFVAGDAAHIHSPAGGQGMNTGIQDAANLGWKLHHVLTGRAAPELLDSYDAERRPVAAHLIAFTSQLMQIATITEPDAAKLRNETLAAAAKVPGVTDWLARTLSQLDIGYNTDHGETINGTRIDPRISKPHGLDWTVITDQSDLPVAVRPDGIAADPAVLSERFGIDLELHEGSHQS